MAKGRTIRVTVMATLLNEAPGSVTTYKCLRCGGELELHQPGIESPDRLLATCSKRCDECGSWHLIDLSDRANQSYLVLLPSPQDFLTAFTAAT